jgi:hypothetical protein
VPGPTIDNRFRSPGTVETPQLLEELTSLPQPSFPESLQVEHPPGGWAGGREDPALMPADLDEGLVTTIRSGSAPTHTCQLTANFSFQYHMAT